MGKGTDYARADAPRHAAVIDDFKDQLILVLVQRLGGKVTIPVAEVDATGRVNLMLSVRDGAFNLEIVRKQ